MQRTVNRIQLHAAQQEADLAYWLAQSVQARIDAVETLRQQHHQGSLHVDTRLQKACRITQLKRG